MNKRSLTSKLTGLASEIQELHGTISDLSHVDIRTRYPIEHDAFTKGGEPVLFCFLPNIPRILKFHGGLSLRGKTGVIACFTFQRELFGRYFGDTARLRSYNFGKISDWLK